ncbi:aminotransferase class V-fold PLP-dependent enzyme [Leptobacterium flavescens]|uniref:cysteine desulfurase n=1 Tax=Leptobacterium flavescens TaxID=472055 RepID=A0A6P0UP14_9FLAO|nr:cysteine desulfurase family protein [Leptobacterium flavescens]NER14180.1 aminotransferase class V-fold PLP-dependent enzyme [Leptobacterium flavescens]
MRKVYFDSAATTQLRGEVIEQMQASLSEAYGNPSSTHSFGRSSKTLIEKARKTIAKYLNAHPSEIIFTSGGTEADNMILKSAVRDLGVKTIITSKIEHHAVLHTVEHLQTEYGIEVKYVVLDPDGTPNLEHLEWLLQSDPSKKLVSLMHVNNEIGNMIDIQAVSDVCKANDALLHSDAVQSIGHWEWDVQKTKVDFLAAAAHKFHGPKGIGFAYIRKDSGLKSLIYGGEQERGYRAGTESTHNIIGLETSFTLAYDNLDEERDYVRGIKRYFIDKIKEAFPDAGFNGSCEDCEKSTYTLVNVRLPLSPEKSQILLFHLDINGIACSKGSACQSGSSMGSHVLSSILNTEELEKPSIRFSFSKFNDKEDVDYVVKVLEDFAKS